MIPFIRSFSELMAITESREGKKEFTQSHECYSSSMDSGQRKRYERSLDTKIVNLPNIPKTIRYKWMQNKKHVSRFIDELDYNNQIQSSYDLTLLERQNKESKKDVA